MIVTSAFGRRQHPVTGDVHTHTGVDLRAPLGSPVVSATPGQVLRVDADGVGKGAVNGNAVFVRAPDGLVWAYLHLARVAVHVGQVVGAGQLLGAAGATGRSTAPHLHLQVTANGKPVDPLQFFHPSTWRFK